MERKKSLKMLYRDNLKIPWYCVITGMIFVTCGGGGKFVLQTITGCAIRSFGQVHDQMTLSNDD